MRSFLAGSLDYLAISHYSIANAASISQAIVSKKIEYYSRAEQADEALITRHFLKWISKKRVKKKLKICEFGGGAGQLLAKIGQVYPNSSLTNVEILQSYQRHLASQKIKFIKGSILKPIFPEHSFDVLIVRDIFHHLVGKGFQETVKNQFQALCELRRLSKPGVVIFVDEYTHSSEIASRLIFFLGWLSCQLGIFNVLVAFLTPEKMKQMSKSAFAGDKVKFFQYNLNTEIASRIWHLGAKLKRVVMVVEKRT